MGALERSVAEARAASAVNRKRQGECRHPEHDPPSHMVYPLGEYEHVCPGCRKPTVVWNDGPVW